MSLGSPAQSIRCPQSLSGGWPSRKHVCRCCTDRPCMTRRQSMLLAAGTLPLVQWCSLPAPTQAQAAAATATLDAKIASAYLHAIYTAVQDLQAASEEEFQRSNFKLRRREFPYYAEQHRSQLPVIPDLSDMSGGLSNPVLFNFVAYCTWKTAGTFVTSPEGRTRLSRLAGKHLAEEIVPEALAAARQRNPGSINATGRQLDAALTQALQRLDSGGYSRGFQICWGSFPSLPDKQGRNTWQTPQELCQPPPEGSPAGNILQIKLQRPADIAGSVALRSEEDGFSGRPAASMLQAVFAAAGFPDDVLADEYFFQDEWSGPTGGWKARLLLLLGDPLQQVDVPFIPSTVVQDWSL